MRRYPVSVRRTELAPGPVRLMLFSMPIIAKSLPGLRARQVAWLFLILMASVVLSGCLVLPAPIATELGPAQQGEHNPFARRQAQFDWPADAAARPNPPPVLSDLPLASGQIVVLDDTSPRGFFSSLMSAVYHPWTHIGILSLETDGPVVYDTDGDPVFIPGLPPTTFGTGRVRRLPLAKYVGSALLAGIFDLPPGVDASKVVEFVRGHYERGTPFDFHFNPEDSRALYCAELVMLALQAGGAAPVNLVPMRSNRSYSLMREWLQMRSPNLVVPGQLVDASRLVAQWRPGFAPSQVLAHFEIRRELLRRFGPDTRIGLMMGWDGDFFLRPEVFDFAVNTLIEFRAFEGSAEDIRREVRRLADLYFVDSPTQPVVAEGQVNP